METTFAVIPTRSKQQALDWSLVLVSQGIETTIEPASEEEGWRLLVSGQDCQRALQALRQYKAENRAPVWRQELPWKGLIFDWRNLAWFLVLAVIFVFDETRSSYLTKAGMMDRQAVWA